MRPGLIMHAWFTTSIPCDVEWYNKNWKDTHREEPDVGKLLVRFCEGPEPII